jgi:hypothetical protein
MNQDSLHMLRDFEWDSYQRFISTEASLASATVRTEIMISELIARELDIPSPLEFDCNSDEIVTQTHWDVISNKRKFSFILWRRKGEDRKIAELNEQTA